MTVFKIKSEENPFGNLEILGWFSGDPGEWLMALVRVMQSCITCETPFCPKAGINGKGGLDEGWVVRWLNWQLEAWITWSAANLRMEGDSGIHLLQPTTVSHDCNHIMVFL